ncbi:hypothetical protein WEU38_17035 [Cyanobacterium aponinum AL20118]|uniref:P pilus assembly protein, chaperone PapD n=1 Tax=Cyanobacterium aponinum AL20115 TaxID=3090662 RepID=A0AAF0ZFS2_9CHRO|nr:hypothetical protein [Cyanobacterium aponinum]WPF88489.1 hypothetical protein SAY89_17115 [Cyanobacterium aponinum AL20115]
MFIKTNLVQKILSTLIFFFPLNLIWANPTYAQIGVSPLVIQENTERGKAQGIINVRNTTNEPIRVRVYTEPFIYDREKGFQTVETNEADLSPYLRFSPTEMTIPPGAERRVRFLAQFPPSLPDQEYRAAIFSETLRQAQDNQQNTVGIIARIGVTVYVRKGSLQPNLTPETATYNPQDNTIRLLVKNTGEATALPKIAWQLNQNGSTIATGEAPETTVMAGSDRIINLALIEKDEATQEDKPIRLNKGQYQLSGQFVWREGNNNPNIIPFETTISID